MWSKKVSGMSENDFEKDQELSRTYLFAASENFWIKQVDIDECDLNHNYDQAYKNAWLNILFHYQNVIFSTSSSLLLFSFQHNF